ncbi:hypothetical protein D3C73_1019800 [compost metagenome]
MIDREFIRIRRFGPVEHIDRIGRIIGIMNEIAEGIAGLIFQFMIFLLRQPFPFPLLGSSVFLPRMKERRSLRSHNQQIPQADALMDFKIIGRNGRILFDRLSDDVIERQIVMSLDIGHHISGIVRRRIGRLSLDIIEYRFNRPCTAGNKSRFSLRTEAGLQFIPDFVREYADIIRFVHPVLGCSMPFQSRFRNPAAECPPAFPDKEDIRIDFDGFVVGVLNGFISGIAHHIPAHAVNFILVEPVLDGVHH